MTYTDTVKGKDGIETTVKLTYGSENGDQITGYGVDAIEASAELEKARQSKSDQIQVQSAE